MKNILRKTGRGLASLVLVANIFCGCGNSDLEKTSAEIGKRIAEKEQKELFDYVKRYSNKQSDPKNEERFARTIYVGQSDATNFYFCDRGKISLRYCGMPSEHVFALSLEDGRFNSNYSADEKVIPFCGHKFEVLNVTSEFVELDHSVCPLTK